MALSIRRALSICHSLSHYILEFLGVQDITPSALLDTESSSAHKRQRPVGRWIAKSYELSRAVAFCRTPVNSGDDRRTETGKKN